VSFSNSPCLISSDIPAPAALDPAAHASGGARRVDGGSMAHASDAGGKMRRPPHKAQRSLLGGRQARGMAVAAHPHGRVPAAR
ncbi:unnamed protein product, partial [Urochloa humidicola]